ncbi:hypothetical protein [Halosimplex amylolyticum]|uniref:hypothetical protein n=1 Tax=Halosimplex amylolyticum TaxID=3396616 RepID=UPI003F579AB6
MNSAVPEGYRHDPHAPDLFVLRCPGCDHEERRQRRSGKMDRRCIQCDRLMGVSPVSKAPAESPGEGEQRAMTDGGRSPEERQAAALEELAHRTRLQNAVLLQLVNETKALRHVEAGAGPVDFSTPALAKSVEDRALELTERVNIDDVDASADPDLMTDGGYLKSRGDDADEEGCGPLDPENLNQHASPAYLQRSGYGNDLVADYSVLDSGWVRVTEWDGERVKFPPHEVQAVREVAVERYGREGELGRRRRLANEEHIEEAREKGGESA